MAIPEHLLIGHAAFKSKMPKYIFSFRRKTKRPNGENTDVTNTSYFVN
jgi:hypothetical protein